MTISPAEGWHRQAERHPYGPRWNDWLRTLGFLFFVALGVLLLARGRGERGAVGCIAFFGLGLVISLIDLVRKLRNRKFARVGPALVTGSVPIRQRRPFLMVAAILVLGLTLAWSFADEMWVAAAMGWVLAAIGLVLLIGFASGRFGGQYLVFEPGGLRFGYLWGSFVARWDNISAATPGEYCSNATLFLTLADVDGLLRTVESNGDIERARTKASRVIRQTRRWVGCDIHILAENFGLDLALTCTAIEGYRVDPARRAHLAPRASLQGFA